MAPEVVGQAAEEVSEVQLTLLGCAAEGGEGEMKITGKSLERPFFPQKIIGSVSPPRCSVCGYVYGFNTIDWKTIKIGFSFNPRQRIRELQAGNSQRLELFGWIHTESTVEGLIHRRLIRNRLYGEWFKWNRETAQILDCLGFQPCRPWFVTQEKAEDLIAGRPHGNDVEFPKWMDQMYPLGEGGNHDQ
jgi:hypothetical protein